MRTDARSRSEAPDEPVEVDELNELSEPRGLSAAEAAARLRVDGPNSVAPPTRRPLAVRALGKLTDPLVGLLLVAAVVTAVLGDRPAATLIVLVVLVNTALGVAQEAQADRVDAALDQLAAPTARVVRDGRDLVVPAADLVRGDLVEVSAGDVVPADLRLVDATRLRLDEPALTGDPTPTGRDLDRTPTGRDVDPTPTSRDVDDEVPAGAVVTGGWAAGTVLRTGASSARGRTGALPSATGRDALVSTRSRPGATPLQRRLTGLGRLLGVLAVALAGLVFATGVLAGRPVAPLAVAAVSLVVAVVPASLRSVVALALTLGARRMASVRVLPRRLHAVETLGSVTVLASALTGTLTEGRMAVRRAVTADGSAYDIAGTGYEPRGAVRRGGAAVVVPDGLRHLARAGLLCNDAALAAPTPERPGWDAVGDPLEAALVAFAARCGLDPQRTRAAWPRVAEQPFDQVTRRMTTVHRSCGGRWLVVCKGAPEDVLTAPLLDADDAEIAALAARARELAGTGLRVLAVATALVPTRPDPAAPTGLRFAGLVAVGDPLRADAADLAASLDAVGVRLLLATGEHPATAAAIGEQLDLRPAGDSLARHDHGGPPAPHDHGHPQARCEDADPQTRHDHGRYDDGRPAGARPTAHGYARTRPARKLDVIDGLRSRGEVVATTGTAVTDVPALRRADVGVAMGGGTEAARRTADLVLVDDGLCTVTAAIGAARGAQDAIRRFLRYALCGGVAASAVLLIGPVCGLPVPLLPVQLLWITLLTQGLPGAMLGTSPARPGTPPDPPPRALLDAGLVRDVLLAGGLIAAVTIGAGVLAARWDRPWQSVVFVLLGLAQLGVALAIRTRRPAGPGRRVAQPALLATVAGCALLQVGGVLVEPLRALLGTDPLAATELAVCAALAALPALALRLAHSRRLGD